MTKLWDARRKVTMPNGKWTTRERTKAEIISLKRGEHDESTEANDRAHIAHLATLPPVNIEVNGKRRRRTTPEWPAP